MTKEARMTKSEAEIPGVVWSIGWWLGVLPD